MAIQNKARWAKLKVGILAIFALSILGALIFLLTGNSAPFTAKSTLYTFMRDSAAVAENAPVRLNGIVVGTVRKISLSGLDDPQKVIRMDLEVQDKYLGSIPVDSLVAVGAENVLGTKFMNIHRGFSKQTVRPGATLQSKDVSDFNDIIEQGSTLLVELQAILKRVDGLVGVVEQGKGSIGKLLVDEELYNRFLATVKEVQSLSAALNSNKGTLGKLVYDDALYRDVRGTLARLDNIVETLQTGQGTAGRFLRDPAIYDEAHRTILDFRKLLADIDAGKGTVGKLLKSEELHNQVAATIGRLDVLLDKINAGQGTIGQFMVNQALYDNLNGATRELHEFTKEFRKNPKKYLHIKLSLF